MNEQKEFVDGLSVRLPNPKAPDFLKMNISFKRETLIAWLQNRTEEWVNVDIKRSTKGTLYAEVNNWKKDESRAQGGEWAGRSMAYEALKATGDQKEETINLDEIPW